MNENLKIISKRNKLTARYNYIIFPFTSAELMLNLNQMNLGYQLLPPPRSPNMPIGTKADWNGPIAKKGNAVIDIDSLPQVLGVESPSPEEASDIFDEVQEIIKNTLVKDLDSHTRFYELVSNYSIQLKNSPITTIRKIKPENDLYGRIGTILGEEIASFGMHFSSTTEIESTHWFDLKIQPLVTKMDSVLEFMIVYRDNDKTKIDKFAKNIEDYISKTLIELEK